MATPFKSADVNKDHYNFYHLQVQINIEFAFGMLVQCWSILRWPLPAVMDVLQKQTALTMALCKLHNFLINESTAIVSSLCQDDARGLVRGSINIDRIAAPNDTIIPSELLGNGEHFDDVGANELKTITT